MVNASNIVSLLPVMNFTKLGTISLVLCDVTCNYHGATAVQLV